MGRSGRSQVFPDLLYLTRVFGTQGRVLASITPWGPQAKGLFIYNLGLGGSWGLICGWEDIGRAQALIHELGVGP